MPGQVTTVQPVAAKVRLRTMQIVEIREIRRNDLGHFSVVTMTGRVIPGYLIDSIIPNPKKGTK